MTQKSKLNFVTSLLILLGIVWLVWTSGISIIARLPLLLVANVGERNSLKLKEQLMERSSV